MVRILKTTGCRRAFLLIILLLFTFNAPVKAASSEETIFIAVNDELVVFADAWPQVIDGVTYVPLRSLAAVMNATISYDESENSVIISKDDLFLKIYITEHTFITETDQSKEMAQKLPFLIKHTADDRILLPLRFIADYFQFQIAYLETGPIARLIDSNVSLTDEQLYLQYKEQIEALKKQRKAINKGKAQQETRKIAYLTFDDGPNKFTSKILDILQTYEAKATFFMIEPKIKSYHTVVKRMVNEDHTIASHSVTHDKAKVYKNPTSLLEEMNQTRATLLTVTGVDSRLIRVPYGSKPYLTKEYRDILANNDLQLWDWNVDSNDWRYSSEKIISTVKSQVVNLEKQDIRPVILFHNGQSTVEALPEIIEFLQLKGYVLKAYDPEQHIMVNFWKDERL